MHTNAHPSETQPASAWIRRFAPLVPAGAPVLDVACGKGRHMRWFAQRGHPVLGVDRDVAALQQAQAFGEVLLADLENGSPWPLPQRQFGAVVVANYLWRPLLATLFASVQPGGVLLYETFAAGHERFGRPSSPQFLLQPAELLHAVAVAGADWTVAAYEHGHEEGTQPRVVQRIAAVRQAPGADVPMLPAQPTMAA